MSSLLRRMQRKVLRSKPDYQSKPQITRVEDDAYWTLRPTKGWVRISYRRLNAQRAMAFLLTPRRFRGA